MEKSLLRTGEARAQNAKARHEAGRATVKA